jgi:SulP family sulfate permease
MARVALLATMMAGVVVLAAGLLRLGTYVKFIPYPVTVGFSAGIAVIILASQLRDTLGLSLAVSEPGAKLALPGAALPTLDPRAVGVTALTIAVIAATQRWLPRWPGMLIALAAAAAASVAPPPAEFATTLQAARSGREAVVLPRVGLDT